MPTRLTAVVIDADDPVTQANWWAAALGWVARGATTSPPPGAPGIELAFVPAAAPRTIKNRVHLDLRSASPEAQRATVDRLLDAGASPAAVGQGADVPWVVLADPEGNEFCVLDPREVYGDTGALAAIVVDANDERALARFWAPLAGGSVESSSEGSTGIRFTAGPGPWLEFVTVPEPHTVRTRLRLGVAGDEEAELTDPEQNEYVLYRVRAR